MRHFVIIGRSATADDAFSLDDLPGTSGRLDVLLRCVRAALLTSHEVRRDTIVDLVLCGGERAPRTLRVSGGAVKYLRPDERPLATLVKKSLSSHADERASGFVEVRPGIAIARGGLDVVLADLGGATPYVLEEGAADVRDVDLDVTHPVFFVGDHLGFDEQTRAKIAAAGSTPISVGPISLHSDDVVAIVSNEIDRVRAARGMPSGGSRTPPDRGR
jgi:tRNA (pseudouridine54-N1)-methyltransferase